MILLVCLPSSIGGRQLRHDGRHDRLSWWDDLAAAKTHRWSKMLPKEAFFLITFGMQAGVLFLVLLLWFPTIEVCWWRHWREKAAVIIVRNWKTFPGKIANWRTYFLRYYYQCWLPLQLSNKKRRFFGNVIKEIMSLMLPFVTTMALRSYTSTCQFAKMFNEQKKYSAEKMHFVGYWNWLLTTYLIDVLRWTKKVNSLQRSFDVEHLFRSTNSTSIYRQ